MNAFRQFVEDNARWFRGHAPETEKSLNAAEEALGVRLPDDIRWLLREFGYWHATGISSLDQTVADTKSAREHLNLPKQYIVLYDHHDGGVILLNTIADPETREHKVYNVGWESVPDHISEEIVHASFGEYCRVLLDNERSFIAEADIDYDPTLYRKR
jgi:hypothetical protein